MNAIKNNKRIEELVIGDVIGNGRMVFLKRNIERDAEARKKGDPNCYVDAVCPFCGNVKTYRYDRLKNGNTNSCGCMIGRVKTRKRTVDENGNAVYKKGYLMNFGWVYDGEAGVDIYGNRIVNVHSKWMPDDKAVAPAKELDSITNPSGMMMCSRWAKNYVEYNNVDLNKLITDADRRIDVGTEIQVRNPHKRKIISTEADGHIVSVQAHGMDEIWIKSLIMRDSETAKYARNTAYVTGGDIFGKTTDYIGDCLAKYADFRTVIERDGYEVDVYEEFDGGNHPINHMSPRDTNVVLGCVANNKGLFKISTRLQAFKDRDAEAVMAIRKFAIDRIRQNIVHNFNVGFNERPTVMRVTNRREIEEAIACEGQVNWRFVAKVSDFNAVAC